MQGDNKLNSQQLFEEHQRIQNLGIQKLLDKKQKPTKPTKSCKGGCKGKK